MSASAATPQDSLQLVESFFAAKERHDLDATMAVFADDAMYVFPLASSGEPTPWFVYDGKPAIREYQHAVLTRFTQIRMLEVEFTTSSSGDRVFVTSHGDYTQADGDRPYTNVYVFRFELRDGLVTRVDEYANPVTYAKLAGLAIG